MSDITSMMIASDNRTLDLPSLNAAASPSAFQIAYYLKHLPANLQPVLSSDVDKVNAFLATFFVKIAHPQGFDFCYAYSLRHAQHTTVLTILTHKKPQDPDDFYALAIAINNQSLYYGNQVMVCDENHKIIAAHERKIFIYSLLQDAALCGHAPAIQALSGLQQDAQANNYHCKSQFNFIYNYSNTNKFLLLPVAMTTPEEFFALANDASLAEKLMVYTNQTIVAAQNHELNELIYSLLNDAAKAGFSAAKDQLIDATIAEQGNARKFVTFSRYNLLDHPILLPRPFTSIDDFYKLSMSLILQGKAIKTSGDALEGAFYILPEGRNAERLGYLLRNHADQMKREEEEIRKAKLEDARREEEAAAEMARLEQVETKKADETSANWANLWNSLQLNNHHSSFFFAEGKTSRLLDIEPEASAHAQGIKIR